MSGRATVSPAADKGGLTADVAREEAAQGASDSQRKSQ